MRPVFCGNLDFDARQSDVERLFKRYGKVERVDMKSEESFRLEMNPHTQHFLCGRITWKIGMPMLFLGGCASLHFISRMCPGFLYFSRRNNLIRLSPAILHSLSIH
ncbi:hypothetical protein Ahy_A02g005185 isoform D [Arachis hypogaea]|uniref:RRM domain-containing protein n=1 Tax=Arachis hypogaea TaxID=3818 RepID=A0A445E6B5_ARAHY|nr:hypothetical protein Ahy_A02g005185 isoform D [Arachis hypogaea]